MAKITSVNLDGIDYHRGDLIEKNVLLENAFDNKCECDSPRYVCLSNWSRDLILEVLWDKESSETFKIYDIN